MMKVKWSMVNDRLELRVKVPSDCDYAKLSYRDLGTVLRLGDDAAREHAASEIDRRNESMRNDPTTTQIGGCSFVDMKIELLVRVPSDCDYAEMSESELRMIVSYADCVIARERAAAEMKRRQEVEKQRRLEFHARCRAFIDELQDLSRRHSLTLEGHDIELSDGGPSVDHYHGILDCYRL